MRDHMRVVEQNLSTVSTPFPLVIPEEKCPLSVHLVSDGPGVSGSLQKVKLREKVVVTFTSESSHVTAGLYLGIEE